MIDDSFLTWRTVVISKPVFDEDHNRVDRFVFTE